MQPRCTSNSYLSVGSHKKNIPFSDCIPFWWLCIDHHSFPNCDQKDRRTRNCWEHYRFPLRKNTTINLKFLKWWDVFVYILIYRNSTQDLWRTLQCKSNRCKEIVILYKKKILLVSIYNHDFVWFWFFTFVLVLINSNVLKK